MCPVNVRTADEHLALGNRISMMVAPLPVGIYDPVERYRQVRTGMAQVKASGESVRMTRILDMMTFLPPALQTAAGFLQVQSAPVTDSPTCPTTRVLYTQGSSLETMTRSCRSPMASASRRDAVVCDTLTIGVTLDPRSSGRDVGRAHRESYESSAR